MMKQFFTDYGMVVVLFALCVGFSAATLDEQHPNGAAAADDIADVIDQRFDKANRIVIVVRDSPDDAAFAKETARLLRERQFTDVKAIIEATPQEGRKEVEQLAASQQRVDAFVTNHYTKSTWTFLEKTPVLFPPLGNPDLIVPESYYWPNFLKLSNLLNIANQIAVIAILAIGMTMVIVTGGIDLSVGSLIALSAVVAAWLIRAAGGRAYEMAIDPTAFIWSGLLFSIGLTALVISLKSKERFTTAFAVVGLGAAGLVLLYAVSPFVIGPIVGILQSLGPTPAVMVVCCLAAIFVCAMLGVFSGGMVTLFRVPPFIVTLAMMLVASGLAFKIAQGQSIGDIPQSFIWLGRGSDLFGIPNAVVLMVVLYLIAHILMTRTVLGRYIYAVGGNAEAARLSGVPVKRVLVFVYAVSGALAGLGGVVLASQLKSGDPKYGTMFELYVIAAAVVGGTSLSGGEGKVLGTLIGAFIIAVIQNGMNLIRLASYDQKVVLGLVILAAVLFDMVKRRKLDSG